MTLQSLLRTAVTRYLAALHRCKVTCPEGCQSVCVECLRKQILVSGEAADEEVSIVKK